MTGTRPGRGQYRLVGARRGSRPADDRPLAAAVRLEPHVVEAAVELGPYVVEAGPDLTVEKVRRRDLDLCFIGTVVDYREVPRSVPEILAELAQALLDGGTKVVAEATRCLGGRWLLLWSSPGSTWAFQDATGLMRLHFTGSGDSLVAGSDPRLVTDDPGAEAAAAEYAAAMPGEYWWPGPISPMPGVRQLMADHCLHLESGAIVRCWPTAPAPPLTLSDAVDRYCALLLDGFSALSALPQGLCMGLTAGLDTRIMLAAGRAFADDIRYFTFRYHWMDDDHEDLVVARRLAETFNLDYSVIPTRRETSPDFARRYRERVMLAHDQWAPLAEAMAGSELASRTLLKGHPGSEAYSDYRGPYPDEDIDAEVLRVLLHLPDFPYVRQSLEDWLEEVWRHHPPGIGPRLTELLLLEHVPSCWQAMSQEEYGCVQDTLSPFNCRALYELAFAVDRRYRQGRVDTTLQRSLIARMWPQLLEIPVNPRKMSTKSRVRERLHRGFPRLHLEYLKRRHGRT